MPVVIFTKHAKIRLKERGINIILVKKVLREPDHITRDAETIVYSKRIGQKNLIVVTTETGHQLIVITAYYENNLR